MVLVHNPLSVGKFNTMSNSSFCFRDAGGYETETQHRPGGLPVDRARSLEDCPRNVGEAPTTLT